MPAMVFEGYILRWGFQMETVSGDYVEVSFTARSRRSRSGAPKQAIIGSSQDRPRASESLGLGDWKYTVQ
jgi:hypothetical protein